MHVYYSDIFELPLPQGHRFPIGKYGRLRDRVTLFPKQLGIQLIVAPAATYDELTLVHQPEYVSKIFDGSLTSIEERRIGFPWSEKMAQRSLHSTGATIAAARAALQRGLAVHLAGGTHHAFADAGQGFCVFNDVAVAAEVLLSEGQIRRALVVDCDVHQGNGTAHIFQDNERVFTFSIHGDRNYPFRKCESDLDIPMADGTEDATYLATMHEVIHQRLPRSGIDAVFYLAGADPFSKDRFGRLSLSKPGLAQRDQLVISNYVRLGIPTIVVMAGGYARDVDDIVDIHARTVEIAAIESKSL